MLGKKPAGPTVEEARAAMKAAGEAPSKIRTQDGPYKPKLPDVSPVVLPPIENVPDFEEEIIAQREPAIPEVPVKPLPVKSKNVQPEKFENEFFRGEIRQEDGEWVAELNYTNGAGREMFSADTKNGLMRKLLEGKGNATLRVRQAVQREKLVKVQPTKLPTELPTDPEEQKKVLRQSLEAAAAIEFVRRHPEYYPLDANKDRLFDYLDKKGWDRTVENFEIAFDDLTADEILDVRPEEFVEQPAQRSTPEPEDSDLELEDEPVVVPPVSTVAPVIVPTPAAVPIVRKRGTTGLKPGHSSVPDVPEEAKKPGELSEAEARQLPFDQLQRIAKAARTTHRVYSQR